MAATIKFSIIIPAYNVELYIRECIESILGQTYANFELIVIDDGSTDQTTTILNEYMKNDPRIKLYSQQNGGPSKARNMGVEKAAGDYILFMDSDDAYAKSNVLEKIAAKCEENDVIAFGWREFDDCGFVAEMQEFPIAGSGQETAYLGEEYLTKALDAVHPYAWYCWRYAFKKEFWAGHNFRFEEGYKYEDVALIPWVILAAQSIVCVREILYNYRINRCGAITMDRSAGTDLNYLTVVERNVKKICEGEKYSDKRLNELLGNNFSIMYYTVMILCSQYRKQEGYAQVLEKLRSCEWITKYTIDTKQKIIRWLMGIIGIDKSIWLLGIRKKLHHGKRK